ncbi:MAG: protein translocase subunit SecF [Candidatus Dormibacteraceae bacterium]
MAKLYPENADQGVSAPRPTRRIDFIGRRNLFFLISLLIIIPGIISMITQGFLLGIDFAGGTEFDLHFNRPPSVQQVQAVAVAENRQASVQLAGNGTYIIRTLPLTPPQQQEFRDRLTKNLGGINQAQVNEVGPTIAGELVQAALLAVLLASLLILFYLAFRFRKVPGGWRSGFQFAGSALLALLHDVFVLAGIFSILGRVFNSNLGQIDQYFLTAVLTVVGFSVHDTIVVFDRIRENLNTTRQLSFEQVANLSIIQTLTRSISTSFTVVLVLIALLLFGGESIRGFVLALLIGIISGTYSSIFNATPLLVVWRRLRPVR